MAPAAPLVHWPQGATPNLEIFWRWLHIVSAIRWIGLLYFFNLVGTPFAAELDSGVRPRVLPRLMWRALNWFRWGALVAVLSGFAYFGQIVGAEAKNGHGNAGAFFGNWIVIWVAVWVIFYVLLRIGNATTVFIGTAAVMILASWLFLRINSHGWESNRSLAIGIGGGMGLFLLLNVWGIVWRANKKVLRWMESAGATAAGMPPELGLLARQSALTSRLSFYLTFVIIFFMGVASHFPLFGV
ncbi:MAG TPA: urate hydroxylase PuuD [Terriglobales bacterium]|nr:urate hydroxylase PuuD [Terriglobales bacterium]